MLQRSHWKAPVVLLTTLPVLLATILAIHDLHVAASVPTLDSFCFTLLCSIDSCEATCTNCAKNVMLSEVMHPASVLVLVAEWVVSRAPATAAKAQLLLDLAARQPQEGQYASWMLPLAATALLNAAPPAAPHLWLQVAHLLC